MTTVSKATLALGGRDLKFAAPSLRQLRELKPQIDLLMSPEGQTYLNEQAADALIDLVIASVTAAGEQGVDKEFLLDAIDVTNFRSTGFALFDRNGFIAKDEHPGEVAAAPSST
ncbi:MAG: hypothetical protein ACREPQ_09615 [Rhodanobacter sp.]